jgi:uncharacterized protein YerC
MPKLSKIDADIKNKRLAKALIKHKGDRSKAWCELHPNSTKSSAKRSASRYLIEHPEAKTYAVEIANKNGLSVDFLMKKVKGMTDAKKCIYNKDELIKVDDNQAQSKAIELGLKIHKIIQNEHTSSTSIVNNTLNMGNDVVNSVLSRIKDVSLMFKGLNSSDDVVDVDTDEPDSYPQVINNEPDA